MLSKRRAAGKASPRGCARAIARGVSVGSVYRRGNRAHVSGRRLLVDGPRDEDLHEVVVHDRPLLEHVQRRQRPLDVLPRRPLHLCQPPCLPQPLRALPRLHKRAFAHGEPIPDAQGPQAAPPPCGHRPVPPQLAQPPPLGRVVQDDAPVGEDVGLPRGEGGGVLRGADGCAVRCSVAALLVGFAGGGVHLGEHREVLLLRMRERERERGCGCMRLRGSRERSERGDRTNLFLAGFRGQVALPRHADNLLHDGRAFGRHKLLG